MIYEPAAKPMRPAGRCQPGAVALLEVLTSFDGLSSSGCYNPRYVANSTTVSLHAEGRAIDVRPSNFGWKPGPWVQQGPARQLGQLCELMAARHVELGVQQIIYAGRSWRVGRGWQPITSATANGHWDHAHIELTRAAADALTIDRARSVLAPQEPDDMYGDLDRIRDQIAADRIERLEHAFVVARREAHDDNRQHDLATPILETRHQIGLIRPPTVAQIVDALEAIVANPDVAAPELDADDVRALAGALAADLADRLAS